MSSVCCLLAYNQRTIQKKGIYFLTFASYNAIVNACNYFSVLSCVCFHLSSFCMF